MRNIIILIFGLLIGNFAFGTGQFSDYLIYNGDTVPIFSNPLEQYFRLKNNRNIPDYQTECISTACWRGYIAYWKLRNDSLFLIKITPPVNDCKGNVDGDIIKMFGKDIAFAEWYNGKLVIPRGKLFSGSDMGYSAIYEYEELLKIENGKKVNTEIKSNLKFIDYLKQNHKLNERIEGLKDTFLFYLNQSMDWEKLDNSKNKWCDATYVLFYDCKGQLKEIKLNTDYDKSQSFVNKFYYFRMDKRCSSKMKKVLKKFSLAYISPPTSFMLEIRLFYSDKLEVQECKRFYYNSTKEMLEWIKKQMSTE